MGSSASVTAEGIYQTHNINYLSAVNSDELESGLSSFLNIRDNSALLEIFTKSEEDAKAWNTFYKLLEQNNK